MPATLRGSKCNVAHAQKQTCPLLFGIRKLRELLHKQEILGVLQAPARKTGTDPMWSDGCWLLRKVEVCTIVCAVNIATDQLKPELDRQFGYMYLD